LLLFSIVLAQLAPILLIPIFFKLEPMEDGSLKTRLLNLCQKFKIDVKEVYNLGLGEKTEKGNAAFVGIGKTKRIIIGDTLYKKFPEEEVEAVFAHELGHQVHNDLWKGIGLGAVILFVGFFIAQYLTTGILSSWFQTDISHPFGMFVFFIVLSIVQMPLNIAQTLFSRNRERAADAFAAEKIGLGKPLAGALERLTYQNWGYFKPNEWVEWLTFSHPAPWRRITKLR